MTDVDYQGETYYTIRNLSLYECQGWCREEVECQAASFSFVANGLGQQETVCLLQNGTQANNPTSKPVRARNQYYMVKMSIRSGEQNIFFLSLLDFLSPKCVLVYIRRSKVDLVFRTEEEIARRHQVAGRRAIWRVFFSVQTDATRRIVRDFNAPKWFTFHARPNCALRVC